MFPVTKSPVPENTLLANYSSMPGAYVDCYWTEIPKQVSFPEFIFTFYTTLLFKLERFILTLTVSKPSTDRQARELSDRERETFAAWKVESRNENELLLCDFLGRTRSWLMVVPLNTPDGARTRLYFGSAVVPVLDPKTGKLSLGWVYQALLRFHKIYSVLLLYSAKQQIEANSIWNL